MSWFSMFRTPVMGKLWLYVTTLGLYSAAVAAFDHWYFKDAVNIHPNLHVLLGTVLGVLIVFRNNTAYDRWWEGRKLWGQLVNDARNLGIKVRSYAKVEPADAHHFGRLLVNFARALKEHLREGIRPRQLSVYRNVNAEPTHVPGHIAAMIREKVRLWRLRGVIDGFDDLMLDVHTRSLMDICGACERIRKTPISRSYIGFIRQSIFLYLFTLPWGLVDEFNFWTIPAVMIIAYFLIGLELIAEAVEEPFGREEDDLVLDDICQGIDASVMEILSPALEKPSAAMNTPSLGEKK